MTHLAVRGERFFSGTLNRDKTLSITGRGAFDNGRSSWRYEVFGPFSATDLTVLKGSLTSYGSGARRDCSVAFLLPPAKLNAIFSSLNQAANASGAAPDDQTKPKKQIENVANDLADKQRDLQTAQEDLKRQRVELDREFARRQDQLRAAAVGNSSAEKRLAEQQSALKDQQDQLAQTAKNLDDQRKALETEHQALIQDQAKTSKDINVVQKLLAGIVLPTTEDPKAWMMRVASVPVQQQQFCRIVDQFYETIGKVYETRNEIKKNTLFRERQQSMAALLPRGEFANWVVQVKEVTQAPDGSAAVMLQPPCRVLLGSDSCQRSETKIQTTIPPNSPTYHELEKISAGDFVVVSGKILYVASNDGASLSTYAVYQAGSHCSAVDGSKQEDVFVTDVRYLVQLR